MIVAAGPSSAKHAESGLRGFRYLFLAVSLLCAPHAGAQGQTAGDPSDTRGAAEAQTSAESSSHTASGSDTAPGSQSPLVHSDRTFDYSGSYRMIGTDEEFDLASLRGKTVLIDFWTTWCRPCIQEIPEANRFFERIADREDVVFVSVNQDEITGGADVEAVKDLVRSKEIAYPVLLDDPVQSLKRRLNIRAWPTKILVGPDGRHLLPASGRMTFATAEAYLDALDGRSGRIRSRE